MAGFLLWGGLSRGAQLGSSTGRLAFGTERDCLISRAPLSVLAGPRLQGGDSALISFFHFFVSQNRRLRRILVRLLWQCTGRETWLNLLSVHPYRSTTYRFQTGQRSARRPIFKNGPSKGPEACTVSVTLQNFTRTRVA